MLNPLLETIYTRNLSALFILLQAGANAQLTLEHDLIAMEELLIQGDVEGQSELDPILDKMMLLIVRHSTVRINFHALYYESQDYYAQCMLLEHILWRNYLSVLNYALKHHFETVFIKEKLMRIMWVACNAHESLSLRALLTDEKMVAMLNGEDEIREAFLLRLVHSASPLRGLRLFLNAPLQCLNEKSSRPTIMHEAARANCSWLSTVVSCMAPNMLTQREPRGKQPWHELDFASARVPVSALPFLSQWQETKGLKVSASNYKRRRSQYSSWSIAGNFS